MRFDTTPEHRRGGRLALLGALVAVLLGLAQPAQAQETVGEWAFKRLDAASKALNSNKYGDAKSQLDRMKERKSKLNPRELALMWQSYGHMYFLQDKYKPAAAAFEQAIAQNALEPQQVSDIRFNLGQLYMAAEQWKKAARSFEAWLAVAQNPAPQARFVVGQNYMQLKNWNSALKHVAAAVKAKPKPSESWLQSLATVQYELKKKRDLIATLKKLIEFYPKGSYWVQLAGMYGDIGDQKRSLAVYELAYYGGFVTRPSELKNLAQMLIAQNVPLKGAQVLEDEMKKKRLPRDGDHLKLLADAYVRAKEFDKAVTPLNQAAKMGKSGDLYLRLAQLHIEQERWQKAIQAASSAVNTGKLKDPGQAHLVRGIASFYAGQKGAAIKALNQAQKSKNSTTANVARQWLALISSMA
ncbi:MAG: tetratricopeptide repeat protein [Myxococcota bacterium]